MPDGCPGTRSSEGGGEGGRYASQRARSHFFGGFGSQTGDVKTGGGGSGAGLMSWHGARVREEVVAAWASSTRSWLIFLRFRVTVGRRGYWGRWDGCWLDVRRRRSSEGGGGGRIGIGHAYWHAWGRFFMCSAR